MEAVSKKHFVIPNFVLPSLLTILFFAPILAVFFENTLNLTFFKHLTPNLSVYAIFACASLIACVSYSKNAKTYSWKSSFISKTILLALPLLTSLFCGLFFAMDLYLAKEISVKLQSIYIVLFAYAIFIGSLVASSNILEKFYDFGRNLIEKRHAKKGIDMFENYDWVDKTLGSLGSFSVLFSALAFFAFICYSLVPLHTTFLFGLVPLLSFVISVLFSVAIGLMLKEKDHFSLFYDKEDYFIFSTRYVVVFSMVFGLNYVALYVSFM